MGLSEKEVEFIKNVGKRVISIRKEKNMQQIELSSKINIEDSALRRIESGRTNPTLKTLLRIAEGLEIDIIELFRFSETEN